MKIFLDANILVSVLNKEYPLFTHSARVLSLIENKKFELYTSPLCLAIAFYFASKKSGEKIAKGKISLLAQKIKISLCDQSAVLKTIENKQIHDFEDGLEYYSALGSACTCIVSEDKDDFYFSEIKVLGCQEFLKKYV
ncbi:MAG: PIN domain-containing protein [Cytophagales bacterium]|nr:PIN domain-containing protein [Cytophagales bacterium]